MKFNKGNAKPCTGEENPNAPLQAGDEVGGKQLVGKALGMQEASTLTVSCVDKYLLRGKQRFFSQ